MLKDAFEDALAEYELIVATRRTRSALVLGLFAVHHRDVDETTRADLAGAACHVLDDVEDVIIRSEGPDAAAAAVDMLLECLPERPLRKADASQWAAIARMTGSAGLRDAVGLYREDLEHTPAYLALACERLKRAHLDPAELLQLARERGLHATQLGPVVAGILRRQR